MIDVLEFDIVWSGVGEKWRIMAPNNILMNENASVMPLTPNYPSCQWILYPITFSSFALFAKVFSNVYIG